MTHTMFREDLSARVPQVLSAFDYIKWGSNAHIDENIRTDIEVVSMKDIVDPIWRSNHEFGQYNAQIDALLDRILD